MKAREKQTNGRRQSGLKSFRSETLGQRQNATNCCASKGQPRTRKVREVLKNMTISFYDRTALKTISTVEKRKKKTFKVRLCQHAVRSSSIMLLYVLEVVFYNLADLTEGINLMQIT